MDVQTTSADRASESERPFAAARGYTPLNWSAASNRELERGAGAELRPYYHAAGITIFHGDCRVILPHLAPCDLLLADPPYGIGADKNLRANKQHGNALAPSRDYGKGEWDSRPADEWAMMLARNLCRWQIVFGGNYYALPPARCWLVWDKENGDNGYADCELAWTNLDKAVRRLKHQWHGMLRKGGEDRWHPTQKPLDVVSWALRQAPLEVVTVLDPWMGSGTTLRAAKDHGKQAIGIEREERWCEIAAKRLEQECLPGLGGGGESDADGTPREGYNRAHQRQLWRPRVRRRAAVPSYQRSAARRAARSCSLHGLVVFFGRNFTPRFRNRMEWGAVRSTVFFVRSAWEKSTTYEQSLFSFTFLLQPKPLGIFSKS